VVVREYALPQLSLLIRSLYACISGLSRRLEGGVVVDMIVEAAQRYKVM
jgi:hypothetical protein